MMKSFIYFLAFFLLLAFVATLSFYLFSIEDNPSRKLMATDNLNFSRSSKRAGYEFLPTDQNSKLVMTLFNQLEERKSEKYVFLDSSLSSFSNFSASGTTSRIPCKSISIFIEDEDPLLSLTAISLVKELKAIPLFQTITISPLGKTPEFGKRKSDLYIRLKSKKENKKDIINVSAGPLYAGGRVNMGQPHFILTAFNLKGSIDIEKLVDINDNSLLRTGKKIAKQVAEKLIEEIQDKVEDWGVCPEFPDYMYPAYTPPPVLDFLKDNKAGIVFSTNELMISNSTFWLFNSNLPPKELQTSLIKLLNKNGWKEERPLISETDYLYLRVNRREKGWFMAIKNRDNDLSPWLEKFEPKEKDNAQYKYSVTFMHLPTNPEVTEIFKKLLKEKITIEQALVVASSTMFSDLSRKQKEELSLEGILDELVPKMSSKQLSQLAQWKLFESEKYPRGEEVRRILVPAFLKECWKNIGSDTYKEISKFGKQQGITGFDNVKQIPFKLTEAERKLYGIYDIASIEGKTLTLNTGEAVPVVFDKNHIISWCIFKKDGLTRSQTTIKSDYSYSNSHSTVTPGYNDTKIIFETPIPYKIKITVSQDGKKYTFTITKGKAAKKEN